MMRILIYTLVFLSFLISCNKRGEDVIPAGKSVQMGFSVEDISSQSRAELVEDEDDATFRGKGIRVFADLTVGTSDPVDVFKDAELTYDGIGTGWNYAGDPKYWADEGQYRFRAFWPSTTTTGGTATTEALILSYRVAKDEDDMMVAYYTCPTKNQDSFGNSNPVPLRFFHTLSAVAVRFRTGVGAQCKYSVKRVYYRWLYCNGSLSFTQDYDINKNESPEWTKADGTKYWTPSNRGLFDDTDKTYIRSHEGDWEVPPTVAADSPQYVQLPWQLMIPQSLLLSKAEKELGYVSPQITIEMEVTWSEDGREEIVKRTTTLTLPTDTVDEWEPGKKYLYEVSLHPNSFDVTVKTTPWDRVDAVTPNIIF